MSNVEVFPTKLPNPIVVGGEEIYEFRNIDEFISVKKLVLEESEKTIEKNKIALEMLKIEEKKQDRMIDALEESVSLLAKRYGVE